MGPKALLQVQTEGAVVEKPLSRQPNFKSVLSSGLWHGLIKTSAGSGTRFT